MNTIKITKDENITDLSHLLYMYVGPYMYESTRIDHP